MEVTTDNTSSPNDQSNVIEIKSGTDSPHEGVESDVYTFLEESPPRSIEHITDKLDGHKKEDVKRALESLKEKHLVKDRPIEVNYFETEKAWCTTTHPEEFTDRTD